MVNRGDRSGVQNSASTSGEVVLAMAPSVQGSSNAPELGNLTEQDSSRRFWTEGFVSGGRVNGDASLGSSMNRFAASGGIVGFEKYLSADNLFGVSVTDFHFRFTLENSSNGGRREGFGLSFCSAKFDHDQYSNWLLSANNFDVDLSRRATLVGRAVTVQGGVPIAAIPGFDESLVSGFHGYSLGGRFEHGYLVRNDADFKVSAFAAIQPTVLYNHRYSEELSNSAESSMLALNVDSHYVKSVPVEIGSQVEKSG